MIKEYHRPQTFEDALALLARHEPLTVPLAGGTKITASPSTVDFAVVDLQALGLNTIRSRGNLVEIGATLTLRELLEAISARDSGIPEILSIVIEREANNNLRNAATVAGTLVAARGDSPFTTALLAMDAHLSIRPALDGKGEVSLGDFLPIRSEWLRGRLITQVTIPSNVRLAYEYIARAPADRPIVCVATARWPAGRTRVALGGYGPAPMLALDGPEPGGAEIAAQEAYSQAGDAWASAGYRREMAGILTSRCMKRDL
jgi:putative selenate reductase FAD-binding subunit